MKSKVRAAGPFYFLIGGSICMVRVGPKPECPEAPKPECQGPPNLSVPRSPRGG